MYYTTLFCVVTIITCGSAQNITKVPVAIYYEALCPDSQNFFTKQLYPSAYKTNLTDFIELQLVPYGKSTTRIVDGDQYQFQCHHGPAECVRNKGHACAIHEIKRLATTDSTSILLDLINCLMSKAEANDAKFDTLLENCSKNNSVTPYYTEIEKCSNQPYGSKYLAELGDLTDLLEKPISFVPTIVFKGKLDRKVSEEARTNFQTTLCKYIEGELPYECNTDRDAGSKPSGKAGSKGGGGGSGTLRVSFLALAFTLIKLLL